jgi:hypothetical protein
MFIDQVMALKYWIIKALQVQKEYFLHKERKKKKKGEDTW